MVPHCPNKRKHYYEGQLKEFLTDLTPTFTAQDQYIKQIGESVKKRLRVEKKWTEQPQRVSNLFVELRRSYPNILKDWAIEQASLAFSHAFFSCHRKYYLRRQASRSRGVDRSAATANVEVSVVAGTSLRQRQAQAPPDRSAPTANVYVEIPVAAGTRSRQRQAQESSAGSSNVNSHSRPAKFSIGAAFVASSYMERVLQHSGEENSQENPIDIDNPPVLKRPPNPYQNRTRSARPVDTAIPQTNTQIDSNEPMKRGIDEIKLFLENCSPSMAHHFDSFIRAGVKNGEYLKAVGRLCASNTDVLSSILGPNTSIIDSILLQAHLLTWSKEVIRDGGRSAQN